MALYTYVKTNNHTPRHTIRIGNNKQQINAIIITIKTSNPIGEIHTMYNVALQRGVADIVILSIMKSKPIKSQ